jgi:mannose-6-phosphate isomerase
MLGARADDRRRFPLLLKFLDAEKMLSVQVHPGDAHTSLLPSGETGKTEAWVVLRASAESRIYAGLLPGTTLESLRRGLARGRPQDHLASFTPKVGDCVFIPAGTVHALGGDLVVFEAQENSDVTFRLFDWGHVDGRTGLPRPLQVENALACVDFARGPVGRTMPRIDATTPGRERLVECDQFSMWRVRAKAPTTVGAAGTARALVSIEGGGTLEHDGKSHPMKQGDVFVLPAAVGACEFRPTGLAVLLEVGLPVPSSPDRSTDGARR